VPIKHPVGARVRSAMLLGAAGACGLLAVVLALRPLPARGLMLVNDLVEVAVPLGVALPCCLAAARAATGRMRWSWALLAGGCAAWGLGQVAWSWFELVAGTEPFPSVADVGFLGAVPLLVLGVAGYPADVLRLGRLRLVLDGAMAAVALVFAATATFLSRVWDPDTGSVLERALLTAYPASDIVIVTVAVALVARRGLGLRGPLAPLVAGVCSLAVADTAFAWLTTTGDHADPVTDVGWPVGFLLIAVAAHRAIASGREPAGDRRDQVLHASGRLDAWLPAAPVVLAAVALAGRVLTGGEVGPVLGVLGGVLLVLVVVRQALVQVENTELARVLERTVVELRDREDELEHQAFHDPLTGLANRALFRDRLQHASARRHEDVVTVLFVDLDDFKTVNDTMGHDIGDQLLVLVAERLRACVRWGDTVARLGGDEFAMLLDDGDAAEGQALGERILAALEVPFAVGGRELRVRASVGVVSAGHGEATADLLLQDADLAMYAAKASGGSRVECFHPVLRSHAAERLDLLGDLEGVLDRGELALFHQPIVHLADGEVVGHEVLLRWRHPTRGLLTPSAFLDLAEEAGHLVPIGWWTLDEACRLLAERGGGTWVSVNLSIRQLHDRRLVERVTAALDRYGLAPRRLAFEVTERALAEGDELIDRLRALQGLGVRIAIDDFGTGYSSLAALVGLPLDALKIDGSFVAGLDTAGGEVLVQAVIDLARSLGLRTVAEGVEEPWQLESLRALGCDGAQGYLLGRPAAPAPATDVLQVT